MDEAAVAEGLDSGAVGGVAVDVYLDEPPKAPEHRLLADHPKVESSSRLLDETELDVS